MQRAGSLGALDRAPRLLWHINCLELWAVQLALRQFRPLLLGKHVLVRMDNTVAVSYINRLGGIWSHRMSQLARHLLLWSHTQFKSLRTVHIPGKLNRAADALSRHLTFPEEWRLHPETIRLIWSQFGEAQVDLFASHESSHCQLYSSLTWPWHRRTGTQLASGLVQICVSPSEPTCTDTVQAQGGWGAGPAGCAALAHPDLVSQTHFPRNSTSLAHSSEEGPPLSGARHHMTPTSRSVEPPCVAPGRDMADLSGLPPAVIETITQARAPSTRQIYALKWSLFANWCSSRREDPRRCTIGVVLYFLQERLERRLSPSTLKVYVAAIAAHHNAVDGRSLGKHDRIMRFLKGARRMNPSRSPLVPSWDLSIVLPGLQRGPFVPESTALRGGRSSLSVAVSRKSIAHIRGPHPELQKLWAAICLPRRSAEREGYLQTEVGPLDRGGRRLGLLISRRAVPPGGEGSLYSECFLLQTSAELQAGWHRTPSQDSTISALSQSLPVSWVTGNGQEDLAGVTFAAPFPLTRGNEHLFSPPVQFPGRWTLVESSKHHRQSDWAEQSDTRPSTGASSPRSPVSSCTGLGIRMAWFPFR